MLISGFCRKRKLEKAFTFMDEMAKRGLKPNNHTYSILIRGMFDLNKVEEAIQLWGSWKRNGMLPDVNTYSVMNHDRWML